MNDRGSEREISHGSLKAVPPVRGLSVYTNTPIDRSFLYRQHYITTGIFAAKKRRGGSESPKSRLYIHLPRTKTWCILHATSQHAGNRYSMCKIFGSIRKTVNNMLANAMVFRLPPRSLRRLRTGRQNRFGLCDFEVQVQLMMPYWVSRLMPLVSCIGCRLGEVHK